MRLKRPKADPAQERSARSPQPPAAEPCTLTLFVSGASDSSARAITDVRELCDAHLAGRHQLTIVDVNQEPATAGRHHILATPSLVKDHPVPARLVVGDMSDHLEVLLALDLLAGTAPAARSVAAVSDEVA